MQQICSCSCYFCAQFGHICCLKAHTVDYSVTDAVVHLIYGVCWCALGGVNKNHCESRISLNSLQTQHAAQSTEWNKPHQNRLCAIFCVFCNCISFSEHDPRKRSKPAACDRVGTMSLRPQMCIIPRWLKVECVVLTCNTVKGGPGDKYRFPI